MAEFTVTTAADSEDPADGALSLREAVAAANAAPGADRVVFDPALSGQVLRLEAGPLPVTDALTLEGDLDGDGVPDVTLSGDAAGDDVTGAGGVTDVAASLSAGALADNTRLFEVSAEATISGLVLTGGVASGDGGAVTSAAPLTLRAAQLSGNRAEGAGGAVHAADDLLIEDTVLSANRAAGPGGAVRADGEADLARVVLEGNLTTGQGGQGGAISAGGDLALEQVRLAGNATEGVSAPGGAVAAGGALELRDATVAGNATAGDGSAGGGLFSVGPLTVRGARIEANETGGDGAPGGAIAAGGAVTLADAGVYSNATAGRNSYGGAVYAPASAAVSDSVIGGNTTAGQGALGGGIAAVGLALTGASVRGNATEGTGASGGGVFATGAVFVVDSGIETNRTEGLNADGGGLYAGGAGSAVSLVRSSVSGNAAGGYGAGGGGLLVRDLTAVGSVVTGNTTAGELGSGGGIAVIGAPEDRAEVRLVTTTLSGNAATGAEAVGGGLSAVGNASIEAAGATVTGNLASAGGGGLFVFGGAALTLGGSLVAGNAAGTGAADAGVASAGTDTIRFSAPNLFGSDVAPTGPGAAGGGALTIDGRDPGALLTVFAGIEPDPVTGVLSGRLAVGGEGFAAVPLAARADNPALDAGAGGLTVALSESALGADLTGDGDLEDRVETLADLTADGRGAGFARLVDAGKGAAPDLGAVELQADALPLGTAPVARADSAETGRGTATVIPVLANDDGADLAVALLSGPGSGTVAALEDGRLRYTPEAGFTGADRFVYTVTDGDGLSDAASVAVTVTGENRPPVARDDSADTGAGEAVEIAVLENDSDPDGDTVSLAIAEAPGDGTAEVTPGGRIAYTPADGFTGTDRLLYRVTDPGGLSDSAELLLAVATGNATPVAEADSATVAPGGRLELEVLANDGDPDGDALALSIERGPRNGSAEVISGGSIAYTPEAGFTGTDTILYRVTDPAGLSATAVATLAVEQPNAAPVARDDAAATVAGEPVVLPVLANDTDADDTNVAIEIVSAPARGTAQLLEGGRVLYSPEAGFTGAESLLYRITDPAGNAAEAEATVTVVASGTPGAAGDLGATRQFTPIFALDVTGNDVGASRIVELSGLTTGNSARTEGGRIFNTGDGTLAYAPRREFTGTDSFDYVIEGPDGSRDSARVEIEVAPIDPDLGTARLVGYLYEAGLGRLPQAGGLDFFAGRVIEDGASETELARGFLNSDEFAARAGGAPETLTDRALVEQLFLNVLERPGAEAGIANFTEDLSAPGYTREDLLIEFAESPENLLGSPEIATIEALPDGGFDFA